jgi:large conductance mechanosensitive channel
MARTRRSGFVRDFQDFALKGNVVDLAVGVVIGAAFGKIITSLVENIVMPFVDPLLKVFGSDWRNIAFNATKFDPVTKAPLDGVRLGLFFGSIVDFAIIALVLFIAIQAIQKMKRKEEVEAAEAPPEPTVVAQERLTGAIEHLTRTIESRQA